MIIKLQGGLGNQMFQYAYGRCQELAGKKIIFDTSFFTGNKENTDTTRNFELDKFNIATKAKFTGKNYLRPYLLEKVLSRLHLKADGFWQKEKYFKNIESEIRNEFALKTALSEAAIIWQKKILETENSISLHIRRGDYVQDHKTNAFHGSCNLEYYKKAVEITVNKIIPKSLEIFVFSDDIDWAKENLRLPYLINLVSNSKIPNYEEMYLMSLCKNNIIANSTFSWWGAWLNQNPNKIVIAPKQWFTHKSSNELEILPKEWIQI